MIFNELIEKVKLDLEFGLKYNITVNDVDHYSTLTSFTLETDGFIRQIYYNDMVFHIIINNDIIIELHHYHDTCNLYYLYYQFFNTLIHNNNLQRRLLNIYKIEKSKYFKGMIRDKNPNSCIVVKINILNEDLDIESIHHFDFNILR